MENEATIFVVDDDAAVGRAVASAARLLGHPIRSFTSANDFLQEYDPAQPGCLVLDLKMPGMTGLELQRKLADEGIEIPIVVISGHADVRIAVEVMTLGAVSLLEKPFHLDELLAQLRRALAIDRDRRNARARQTEADAKLAGLTLKEREVLDQIAKGMTNKEIATALGLSVRAVEDRRARLMKKVQARSVAELVQLQSGVPVPADTSRV